MPQDTADINKKSQINKGAGFRQTAVSLSYPNYRKWFVGQTASLVGTWMQSTAQGFLVYQLTGSVAYLGVVAFAAGLPTWLFSLFGGIASEQMPRRLLLIITQTFMMLLAFILAAIVRAGIVQPWHVVALAFLLGIGNAFDAPARLAFVSELVDRSVLQNAIALNSAMVTLAFIVGPAVAGIAYAALGAAWSFTINGFSFIAVILALISMKLPRFTKPAHKISPLRILKEGISYARHHASIRVLLVLLAVLSFIGNGILALLPAWAVQVLGGGSETNGFLQSARGIGSLIAAVGIAAIGNGWTKGRLLTLASFFFPVMIILWTRTAEVGVSLLCMLGVGAGFMTMLTMANTLVQSLVDENMRGRVSSLYTLSYFGMMPVGSLIIGVIAEKIGEPPAVLISGIIFLCFALALYVKFPHVRTLE